MAAVASAPASIPSSLLPIILDSPAASTPDGEAPNFIDPPNLHVQIYVTLVLCLVLTTVTLAARIYTKAYIIRSLDWDDCTNTMGLLQVFADRVSRYHCHRMGRAPETIPGAWC
jgi:hypothetical protein